MSTVVAAIDNSAAASPVLRTALAVAHMTGADVMALHVVEADARNASDAASYCGVPLQELTGDVVEQLVAAAARPDVEVLVAGARGRPLGARPAGHVALELMTRVAKPLVLVPPQARVPDRIARLLVPLDGTPQTARALEPALVVAARADVEIIVLHVSENGGIPAFSDQIQYETDAFGDEFIARNARAAHGGARLELRIGAPGDHVLDVSADLGVDMVALGWSQHLEPGRARIVRHVIEHAGVPVELVPLSEARVLTRAEGS